MASLVEHVRSKINPTDYYKSVFPDIHWSSGTTEARVNCCFHQDKQTPSLHLNSDNGKWYCHGCNKGGNSIVSFHGKVNNISSINEAAIELFVKYIHPVVSDKTIRRWHRQLRETPSAIAYLRKERLLSEKVIDDFELGWNGSRITIPIRNEFGLCVNVKCYDPLSKKHGTPKMYSYSLKSEPRSFGSPTMLYPVNMLQTSIPDNRIFVCEGEWDTLALISLGLAAITTTNGSKSWANQYNWLFLGKEVIICYDNDKDGKLYDRKVVLKNLSKYVKRAKRIDIPKEVGKDVTDWLKKSSNIRAKAAWIKLAIKSPLLLENPESIVEQNTVVKVSLDQASRSSCFGRRIQLDALVTGKDIAPYMLPKLFRASCDKSCDECPFLESTLDFKEQKIEPNDPNVLRMVDATEPTVRRMMLDMVGISSKPICKAKIDVLQTFNLEQILLIPTLDTNTAQYVLRSAYYVGHGLHSNRAYTFEGATVAHPQDQHTTHLLDKATPVQGEVETFQLTPEVLSELIKFKVPEDKSITQHFLDISEWQSATITKIKQRPDLHTAVDLVFHSLPAFEFNGEFVKRGMLDVLIIGDTRCGKGYVTEELSRFYGLGEVASGEMCSFAGLIGGLQQVGKRWIVTWGVVPLNHGRLVVIDEASSLSVDDFGKMSRVRSEGIAEISKIIRESTQANTRLLWLSNTRSGRKLERYNSGVEAIAELVGANEDVSRFDFAITVATNEVPSSVINQVRDVQHSTGATAVAMTKAGCRSLVLWAWSRRPDQVKFTEKATQAIIHEAIKFGKKYSSTIPLVQGENIRIKLAKVSAAIAARVFSSDASGNDVIVQLVHVNYASQFLQEAYGKESMGYEAYSKRSIESSSISEQSSSVDELFRSLGKDNHTVTTGLLNLHRITPDSLGDYVGDPQASRSFIGDLVRLNCISRVDQPHGSGGWYLKNPSFTTWLKSNNSSQVLNGKKIPLTRITNARSTSIYHQSPSAPHRPRGNGHITNITDIPANEF